MLLKRRSLYPSRQEGYWRLYYFVMEIFLSRFLNSSEGSKSIALVPSINTGTKRSETKTAATVPEINATPNPPKTGSLASNAEPRMIATAVSMIGLALVAAATAIDLRFLMPCASISDLAKSIKRREFLELIPINAIKPMSEVAVRKKVSLVTRFATQCPTMTPIKERKDPSRMIPLKAKLL